MKSAKKRGLKINKIRPLVKDKEKLQKLEDDLARQEKADVKKNFRIIEAMYEEAVALGAFPSKNPLSGIEIDIQIAKVVNSVSDSS